VSGLEYAAFGRGSGSFPAEWGSPPDGADNEVRDWILDRIAERHTGRANAYRQQAVTYRRDAGISPRTAMRELRRRYRVTPDPVPYTTAVEAQRALADRKVI
jgi:hypothetical protein